MTATTGQSCCSKTAELHRTSSLDHCGPFRAWKQRQFVHHMSGASGQAPNDVPTALELFGVMLATPPALPATPSAAHAPSKPEGSFCPASGVPSGQMNAVPPLTRIAVVALSRQLATLSPDVDKQIQGGWANSYSCQDVRISSTLIRHCDHTPPGKFQAPVARIHDAPCILCTGSAWSLDCP